MGKTLDDMAKKAKTISEIIVQDVLSHNGFVDLENESFLPIGTIVGFDETKSCWVKVTEENKGNFDTLFGVLKDNLSQNGTAGILRSGVVQLDGVSDEIKSMLNMLRIIVE